MELIDQRVRTMDFLIALSAEEIFLLEQVMSQQVVIERDSNNPMEVKAHDFFAGDFYKFILERAEEARKHGIGSDRS